MSKLRAHARHTYYTHTSTHTRSHLSLSCLCLYFSPDDVIVCDHFSTIDLSNWSHEWSRFKLVKESNLFYWSLVRLYEFIRCFKTLICIFTIFILIQNCSFFLQMRIIRNFIMMLMELLKNLLHLQVWNMETWKLNYGFGRNIWLSYKKHW